MRTTGRIVYALGVVLPLAAALLIAVRHAFGEFTVDGLTSEHFHAVIDPRFLRSVGFTFALALVSTALAVWMALGAVRLLKAPKTLPALLLAPLALPPVVVAFVVFHLLSGSGLVSRMAHALGLVNDAVEFVALVNDPWGIGIAAAQFALCFPALTLYMLYVRSGSDLHALDAVSQSLGASSRDRWKRVIRPVLVQRAWPLVVVYFVFALGTYEVAKLLGAQRIQAVVPFIADRISGYNLAEVPEGYALAVVYTVFIAVVMAAVSKRLSHG